MTVPDKPRSSQQKYRLTKKGAEYLKKQGSIRAKYIRKDK